MEDAAGLQEEFALALRCAVARMHRHGAAEPIRYPAPHGALPRDTLLRPPPVVVDANIVRNDIRRVGFQNGA
jgi:hypothetical protein